MPSARLRLEDAEPYESALPEVIRTPNGTVLIEIQGVVNVGSRPLIRTELDIDHEASHSEHCVEPITLGSLDISQVDEAGKPVKLLVGQNQMLAGHVQKLPLPLAVLRMPTTDKDAEVIPVVEIITHKLLFNKRPEPVVK